MIFEDYLQMIVDVCLVIFHISQPITMLILKILRLKEPKFRRSRKIVNEPEIEKRKNTKKIDGNKIVNPVKNNRKQFIHTTA